MQIIYYILEAGVCMNLDSFKWINKSKLSIDGSTLTIYAPAKTDYFNNPIPKEDGSFMEPQGNAPFLYTDVEGDFVAKVRVKQNYKTDFDAGCLMVIQDENLWIKAALEKSDFDTVAVVSVVTNKISDDANGCNTTAEYVWLQIARVKNNFAIHYSLDGVKFDMVRVLFLPVDKIVKVGIEAQCPTGEGDERIFTDFYIEKRTITNLRAGK